MQGECMVPAKPLWLVVQLDDAEDRVEVRRSPLTPALEDLVGGVPSSDGAPRTEATLHSTLLLGTPRDPDAVAERFSVQGLFRPLKAKLPDGKVAYAGPGVRLEELSAENGQLEVGVDLTRVHQGTANTGPWLWCATPSNSTEGEPGSSGSVVHAMENSELKAGDVLTAVAIGSADEKLVALALLLNGGLAVWWDLEAEGPSLTPTGLRFCIRVRSACVHLVLEEPAPCQALVEAEAAGLSKECWNEILQLRPEPLECMTCSVTAVPKALLPDGKRRLVEEHLADAWAEFRRLGFQDWSDEDDKALVRLAQRVGENARDQPVNLAQLRGLLGKGGMLGAHDVQSTHVRYSLLKSFNNLVNEDVLPFVDVRTLRAASHGKLLLSCRSCCCQNSEMPVSERW